MNDLQVLIEQMVSDISSHAVRLDDLRLHLFLGWLGAHGSKVKISTGPQERVGKQVQLASACYREGNLEGHLKTNLKPWLESLPMQGLLREYHPILNEIAWWRDLDPRRLTMVLGSEERW